MSTATRKRIPNYLTIEAVVKAALAVASREADEFPTQREIAKEAGVSLSTVNLILQYMDSGGLITRTRTGGRIKRVNYKTVTEGAMTAVLAEMDRIGIWSTTRPSPRAR